MLHDEPAWRAAGRQRQRLPADGESPGALPDIFWKGKPVGTYDPAKDAAANKLQQTTYASGSCKVNLDHGPPRRAVVVSKLLAEERLRATTCPEPRPVAGPTA